MLGRCVGSAPWGFLADKYGRKPVIICGTAAMYVILKYSLSLSFSIQTKTLAYIDTNTYVHKYMYTVIHSFIHSLTLSHEIEIHAHFSPFYEACPRLVILRKT
jgi:MFS family permease